MAKAHCTLRLTILGLPTIMTGQFRKPRGRREMLLAPIALLVLNTCRGATEPCSHNCWTTAASMPNPYAFVGAGVVNGVLYGMTGTTSADVGVVQAYDPAANTWTTKFSGPTPPRLFPGVGIASGVLYAVGGTDGGFPGLIPPTYFGAVDAYDPAANTWSAKTPMPTARAYLGVGVVNGVLYAIGGGNNTGTLGVVEAYDPVANTWTTKAPMPTARTTLGVGVVNGVLYAVGGANAGSSLGVVEAYDPVANTWTTKASMPTARATLGVGVVNGVLYAVGGYNSSLSTLVANEAYHP